jgi:hypothetical protein
MIKKFISVSTLCAKNKISKCGYCSYFYQEVGKNVIVNGEKMKYLAFRTNNETICSGNEYEFHFHHIRNLTLSQEADLQFLAGGGLRQYL